MMEFSMRSFQVVSLLLLVSLSTDAISCNWNLCRKYCSLLGKPACCPGPSGPCRCTAICPRTSGPLVVDAQVRGCDYELCEKFCSLLGKPACCAGLLGPCRCSAACPYSVKKEITEEVMAGAIVEEPFIKEVVIA